MAIRILKSGIEGIVVKWRRKALEAQHKILQSWNHSFCGCPSQPPAYVSHTHAKIDICPIHASYFALTHTHDNKVAVRTNILLCMIMINLLYVGRSVLGVLAHSHMELKKYQASKVHQTAQTYTCKKLSLNSFSSCVINFRSAASVLSGSFKRRL